MRVVVCIVMLLLASINDIRTKTIPIWLPMAGIVCGIILMFFSENKIEYVYGFIFGILMVLLSLLLKNYLGIGDSFMIMSLGLLCGLKACLEVVFVALVLTSLLGIVLCVGKRRFRETSLPFMPFLLAGVIGVGLAGGIH